jgi:hypothetical protein
MKYQKKGYIALVVAFAFALASAFTVTATASEGDEAKVETKNEAGFICTTIPWLCGVKTAGNGGGKEPPK